MVGAKLKPLFEAEARERKKAGKKLPANLPGGEARQAAADLVNVSPRSVEHASKVLDAGAEELIAAVGVRWVSVSAAALPPDKPEPEPVASAEGAGPFTAFSAVQ